MNCRYCDCPAGEVVLDLGDQPACEYFPPLDAPRPDPTFPLRLWLCAQCSLAQLVDDAALPDEPEGIEPAVLTQQRADAIAWCAARGYLAAGATVAEGPTPHGGSWLPGLAAHGIRPVAPGEPADLVVDGSFGLMHAADQRTALSRLVARLKPGGRLLFQFHSLAAILRGAQWNAVRLGHYAYYSTPAVCRLLADFGLTVTAATQFPLYGGTVLVSATADGDADDSVRSLLAAELAEGVASPGAIKRLQAEVDRSIQTLRGRAERARAAGTRLYGYSAASRAVALLHLAGIDDGSLAGVADASPAKQGCRMPGTAVPIITPEELVRANPAEVVVFVPDLVPEVRRALPDIEASGGRWIG